MIVPKRPFWSVNLRCLNGATSSCSASSTAGNVRQRMRHADGVRVRNLWVRSSTTSDAFFIVDGKHTIDQLTSEGSSLVGQIFRRNSESSRGSAQSG